MEVNSNKYYDVTTKENEAYLQEIAYKPQHHQAALATLKKIESVLQNQLKQIQQNGNPHPLFKDEHLLKSQVEDIHTRYTHKQSKLNPIIRKFFSQEKEVSKTHEKIKQLISSISDPVNRDKSSTTFSGRLSFESGSVKDLQADPIQQAQAVGYQGVDKKEATQYLKNIVNELHHASKQNILPKDCLVYYPQTKEINLEKTLKKVTNLSPEQTLNILSQDKIYSSSFRLFKFFYQTNYFSSFI